MKTVAEKRYYAFSVMNMGFYYGMVDLSNEIAMKDNDTYFVLMFGA